jgi:hypothetical protein
MKNTWIVYGHPAGLMIGEIIDVIGNSFGIRYRYAVRLKSDDHATGCIKLIKLESIADLTDTEHFIFDTESQAYLWRALGRADEIGARGLTTGATCWSNLKSGRY